MWLIVGILVAVVLLYDLTLKLVYLGKARWAGVKPARVFLNFPFGIPNLLSVIKSMKEHKVLDRLVTVFRSKGSKTYVTELMGRLNMVTLDPENIKAVLATDFKSFDLGLREPQLSYFLGNGIFTLSAHGWKHSRTLLRPQFSREQIAQIDSLREHVGHLEEIFDKGEFVEAQLLFHQLTMDTATEFLFGESVNSLQNSQRVVNGVSATQFVEAYTTGLQWSVTRIQFGPLYRFVTSKEFREAISRTRKFIDYFVQEALDRKVEKDEGASYIFTHELAKVTRDPVTIRDQAFNILLAGRDTTASLLSYTLWHLAHHPEIFARLRKAVLDEFGTGTEDVTFEGLKRCKYLLNVINETLRVSPTVPRNMRAAVRDTQLPRGGGPNGDEPVFVPKGMPVVYSVYELHRQPELWGEDCEEFRPERWNTRASHGWEYLPFNGGPRICLGQQFALTEASFTVMRIAQKYDRIELEDPTAPLINEVNLTSSIFGGVRVKMHLAKSL